MCIKHRSIGIKFQKIQDISIHTNKPQKSGKKQTRRELYLKDG